MTAETEKAKLPAEIVAAIREYRDAVVDRTISSNEGYTPAGKREAAAEARTLSALEAAIAQALSAAPAREIWLDIATAPKDASPFIAISKMAQYPKAGVCWWQNDGWYSAGPPQDFVTNPFKWWPTHWQPMPGCDTAPPAASAQALSAKPQPAAPETDNRDENGLAPTWRLDLAKRNVSAKIYAAQQGPLEVSLGWLKGLASFLDSLPHPTARVGEVEKAILLEMSDRRLLDDVDADLHAEIGRALAAAAIRAYAGRG